MKQLEELIREQGGIPQALDFIKEQGLSLYNKTSQLELEIPSNPMKRASFENLINELSEGHGIDHLVVKGGSNE